MKRKGFTLVELLAVIVILSVISIITIPLIGNVIEDSKKKALEQSVYGLVEAANYYALYNDYAHVVFGTEEQDIKAKEILNYTGSIDAEGDLYIDKDGDISLCLMNEDYYVYKNYNSGIVIGDRSKDSCKAEHDPLTNKYIAYLESEGEGSNVYDKEYINNLEDNLQNQITSNDTDIENINTDITNLQESLNNYALKTELETTNGNMEALSTKLSSSISQNVTDITNLQNSVSDLNNSLTNVSTILDELKDATFINNSQTNISEIECDSGNGVFLVYVSTYSASNYAVNYAGVYLVGVNPIDIIVSYRTILEPSSWASGISFSATEKGFKVTFAALQNYTVSYIKIV